MQAGREQASSSPSSPLTQKYQPLQCRAVERCGYWAKHPIERRLDADGGSELTALVIRGRSRKVGTSDSPAKKGSGQGPGSFSLYPRSGAQPEGAALRISTTQARHTQPVSLQHGLWGERD
jgi:hypothetical protein